MVQVLDKITFSVITCFSVQIRDKPKNIFNLSGIKSNLKILPGILQRCEAKPIFWH